MPVPNPFEQLGLTMEATPEQVRARFLTLAKIHHPDAGGDALAFQALHQAHDQALEFALRPKPCLGCRGSKVQIIKNGFSTFKKMCPVCKGSGQRPMNTEGPAT